MAPMFGATALRARFVLLAALAVGVIAASLPATADPGDRLEEIERRQEELQAKIDRAVERKGEILSRIKVVDSQRAEVDAEVQALDAELADLNSRISVVTGRLTRAQQELAILHNELETILGRLVNRTNIFTERAVAAYKAGPTAYLDGLVSSESFGDLVESYSYYKAVLDSDSELIEEIEVLRAETEQKRSQVEAREEQIAADKKSLETDRARVAAIRADRADALASLRAVLSTKQQLLASVESKRGRYEKVQDQLERDADRVEALLASTAAAPSGTTTSAPAFTGAAFAWPAPGPVTSGYGYRIHPIFGDRRLHTGIDISAPYGSTVIAAEGGVVVFVGAMSGYGNVVVVDHGGGIATTYNHLSAFSVTSGQSVSRSQPIASVGCTGYCTGPHLHFEVRVNGTPVDPMPYLQ
jgi:murein DD-endopeptidase MepM/ murein hydrolase activator NlpD